ncbi:MAG: PIN domain-containing protein [Spirochaetia bacterium]|jgi:tRNA(fMet)-specific endonuclease VapC
MPYLIDTDILINSIKGNKTINQRIAEYAAIPKAISIITFGELLYGAKKSTQRDKNTSVVYRLAEIFPIIGITRSTIEAFTDVKMALDTKGERIEDFDLLIAATALSLNYTLVTNNTKHYKRIEGLELENWMS